MAVLRNLILLTIIACMITILIGCNEIESKNKIEKVGLLVPETIMDPVWGSKGYKGLINIQNKFDVEVFYKEGMNNQRLVSEAIKEFDEKGVNLVFGHGSEYAPFFKKIHKEYPDIHFVYFNGDMTAENVTSLNFEAYAMGFFGGMVAGKMTETDKIGVIAAFEWQPEIKGFIDGVKYQNQDAQLEVHYTSDWYDKAGAIRALEKMIVNKFDVFYPAGDAFNIPVIEKIKANGLYAIGFLSDQSDLGEATVLTSTVQHVDVLYEVAAQQFNNGELPSGAISYDFKDGVISMGTFSPLVPESYKAELMLDIQKYKESGLLPNQVK